MAVVEKVTPKAGADLRWVHRCMCLAVNQLLAGVQLCSARAPVPSEAKRVLESLDHAQKHIYNAWAELTGNPGWPEGTNHG